jgi:hypothetical protein
MMALSRPSRIGAPTFSIRSLPSGSATRSTEQTSLDSRARMKVQLKFSMRVSRGRSFGGVVTAVILGTESVSGETSMVRGGRGGRERPVGSPEGERTGEGLVDGREGGGESGTVRDLDATERVAEDRSLTLDLLEGWFLDSRVRTVSTQGRFAGSSISSQ